MTRRRAKILKNIYYIYKIEYVQVLFSTNLVVLRVPLRAMPNPMASSLIRFIDFFGRGRLVYSSLSLGQPALSPV